MFVKFQARYNGDLWYAEAENQDIFAVGESIVDLMNNVDAAARLHFSGRMPAGEELHIVVANEVGARA